MAESDGPNILRVSDSSDADSRKSLGTFEVNGSVDNIKLTVTPEASFKHLEISRGPEVSSGTSDDNDENACEDNTTSAANNRPIFASRATAINLKDLQLAADTASDNDSTKPEISRSGRSSFEVHPDAQESKHNINHHHGIKHGRNPSVPVSRTIDALSLEAMEVSDHDSHLISTGLVFSSEGDLEEAKKLFEDSSETSSRFSKAFTKRYPDIVKHLMHIPSQVGWYDGLEENTDSFSVAGTDITEHNPNVPNNSPAIVSPMHGAVLDAQLGSPFPALSRYASDGVSSAPSFFSPRTLTFRSASVASSSQTDFLPLLPNHSDGPRRAELADPKEEFKHLSTSLRAAFTRANSEEADKLLSGMRDLLTRVERGDRFVYPRYERAGSERSSDSMERRRSERSSRSTMVWAGEGGGGLTLGTTPFRLHRVGSTTYNQPGR